MDLDRAADELYGLPPGDFVARRTELARAADDKAVAKLIRALRRPTVSAWAVNRFARAEPGLLETLLTTGEDLREAWSTGEGRAEADRARTRAVDAAVKAAVALAGRPLPEQVRREIEDTFQAALVDPAAAGELAAARLFAPLSRIGFDFSALPPAPAKARTAGKAPARNRRAKERKPPGEDPRLLLRRLEVEAAHAAETAKEAESALAALRTELDEAEEERTGLEQRLAELSAGLKRLRAALGPAEKAASTARAAADVAAGHVARAR
ncbi:hypothetical protein [Actinocorallia longicatena]|uniref:Transposase n=1 Tax=Actinocorallia longicatena TaxID=111803 RepID=A0ABP6Q8P2_9ACTN